MFEPDIFKTVINLVIENFDFPSHRIGGDGEAAVVCKSNHRCTKSFRFPRFKLRFASFNTRRRDRGKLC